MKTQSILYEIERPDGTWDKKNIIVEEGTNLTDTAAIILGGAGPDENVKLRFPQNDNGKVRYTELWTRTL